MTVAGYMFMAELIALFTFFIVSGNPEGLFCYMDMYASFLWHASVWKKKDYGFMSCDAYNYAFLFQSSIWTAISSV